MRQTDEDHTEVEEAEVSHVGFRLDPEIETLFRRFEIDIKVGDCSIKHRANTSHYSDEILKFGKDGLALILIHLLIEQIDDIDIIQAWVYILSWIAEDEKIEDVPKNIVLESAKDVQAWVDWTKTHSGLIEVDINEDDQESIDEILDPEEVCHEQAAE
jgi:hypothetical protein